MSAMGQKRTSRFVVMGPLCAISRQCSAVCRMAYCASIIGGSFQVPSSAGRHR